MRFLSTLRCYLCHNRVSFSFDFVAKIDILLRLQRICLQKMKNNSEI